jgi:hypothetical protein
MLATASLLIGSALLDGAVGRWLKGFFLAWPGVCVWFQKTPWVRLRGIFSPSV